MNNVFKQIHRFAGVDIQFTPGKEFEFTLNKVGAQAPVVTQDRPKQSDDNLPVSNDTMVVGGKYTIHVKNYMTEPATQTFDFQDKWNNGVPMPLVIMDGEVLQETRGMFRMRLQGAARPTSNCCCCGRRLTNKISMLYGVGPECGGHFYINPFNSEEELNEHWEELKQKMANITWEGWVIKSAIKEWSVVE